MPSVDRVVPGADRQGSAADVDISFGIVLVVFRVQAVRPGRQVQGAARDPDGIIGFNGLGGGFDRIGAPGDLHIILAGNAVFR